MALICSDLESILKACESAVGGLNQVIYINDSTEVDFDAFTLDAPTHTYTALALEGTVPFEKIEFRKNLATLSEDYALEADGSVLFTQTLVIPIHGRDAAKSRKISLIAAGQRNVDIIVVQNDGGLVYLREAQLSTIADGTMAEKKSGSKYTLTFTAESEQLAYFVDPTALAAVLPA